MSDKTEWLKNALVTDAEAFISSPHAEATKCPECGSQNWSYRMKATVSREVYEALGAEEAFCRSDPASLVFVLSCKDCGHEWQEDMATSALIPDSRD